MDGPALSGPVHTSGLGTGIALLRQMKITLYKKSGCPWAAAVTGFLRELDVSFETKNVSTHPQYATELEKQSGRCVRPTLDLDGQILVDASVEDVGRALEKRGIVF